MPRDRDTPPPQRSRGWCFTLNNHTEQEVQCLLDCFEAAEVKGYVFQEETGAQGTPHLQGVAYFKNACTIRTLKQFNNRLHLERTRNINQSVDYCSSPDKRTGRIWNRGFAVNTRQIRLIDEAAFHPWQSELIDELRTQPNDRTVIWYYDSLGSCGKTVLCKWILAKLDNSLFLNSSSGKDLAYQIVKASQDPKIVIVNLPRQSEGFLSYGTFESIKDGLVFSGKYEGGTRSFNPPHLVIFANFLPDHAKLSADRWDIRALQQSAIGPIRLY